MRNYKILTSFWFLLSLIILLLNDFALKGFYGNWLTGKLSDFSGLLAFSLFWTAFLPKHKVKICLITGVLFIYWKSQWSEPLVEFWNRFDLLNVHRTVDYSDLIALAVLPVAYFIVNNTHRLKPFKINPVYPALIAAFAFMATSYHTEVNINKEYHFPFPKDTLINRLNRIDSLNYGHAVLFTGNNPDTVDFHLPSTFCFKYFAVKVAVTESKAKSTNLTLISAQHNCPKGKKDNEELTKEFETKIIERIKNN